MSIGKIRFEGIMNEITQDAASTTQAEELAAPIVILYTLEIASTFLPVLESPNDQ